MKRLPHVHRDDLDLVELRWRELVEVGAQAGCLAVVGNMQDSRPIQVDHRLVPDSGCTLGTSGGALSPTGSLRKTRVLVLRAAHPVSTIAALSGLGPSSSWTKIVSASAGTPSLKQLPPAVTS